MSEADLLVQVIDAADRRSRRSRSTRSSDPRGPRPGREAAAARLEQGRPARRTRRRPPRAVERRLPGVGARSFDARPAAARDRARAVADGECRAGATRRAGLNRRRTMRLLLCRCGYRCRSGAATAAAAAAATAAAAAAATAAAAADRYRYRCRCRSLRRARLSRMPHRRPSPPRRLRASARAKRVNHRRRTDPPPRRRDSLESACLGEALGTALARGGAWGRRRPPMSASRKEGMAFEALEAAVELVEALAPVEARIARGGGSRWRSSSDERRRASRSTSAKAACAPAWTAATCGAARRVAPPRSPWRCASRARAADVAASELAAVDALLDRVRAMLWRLTH